MKSISTFFSFFLPFMFVLPPCSHVDNRLHTESIHVSTCHVNQTTELLQLLFAKNQSLESMDNNTRHMIIVLYGFHKLTGYLTKWFIHDKLLMVYHE